MEKFRNLGLSETAIQALEQKGFEEPTEIQEKTIPLLLESTRNIIAQAQTGTGKTAAFGLVFIEKLFRETSKGTKALVLTPTRELAVQVAEEINSLKGKKKLNIVPIYGGQSMHLQLKQLKNGVDVVVGTPGRVLDHIRQKSLNLSQVKYAVLDEADEMLNMGFIEEVENILSNVNSERQLLLFSATMPGRIKQLAKKYMGDYLHVQSEKGQVTTNLVDQIYFEVRQSDKFEALTRIVDIEAEFYGIIFCRTKINVDLVAQKLNDRGYSAEALHGDVAQSQRERVLASFKKKRVTILVATDVAARGIDVQNVSHVINFSLPQDPESYVHRIGRTGRAGNEGTAITFITPAEYRRLSFIQKITKSEIRKELIPGVKDIIAMKKERIIREVQDITAAGNLGEFSSLADAVLEGNDPRETVAALLKYSFADELNTKHYSKIKDISNNKNSNSNRSVSPNALSTTRLFVTLGKRDDMTRKKVALFIEEKAGIDQCLVQNIDVFDSYSFITVPFEEAEIILEAFKKLRYKKRALVAQEASEGKSGKSKKGKKRKKRK